MSEEKVTEKKPFTVKGFFKSTSFKCIAVLLAIVLISGILLTICNSLFYVSDAERLQRVLNSIYGREVTATEVGVDEHNIGSYEIITDGSTAGFGDSMAEEVKDGSLFVRKTECQIRSLLNFDGEFTTGNLGDELHTGATNSNFLCAYAALFAAANYDTALAGDTDFVRTKFIDLENTSYEVDGNNVVFTIASNANGLIWGQFIISVTVGEGGVITDYTITQNGSSQMPEQDYGDLMNGSVLDGSLFEGKDEQGILEVFSEEGFTVDTIDSSLATGATYSNFLGAYAALFALANYDEIKGGAAVFEDEELDYTQYIDLGQTTATVNEDSIDYTVVTTSYGRAGAFTIDITVRGGFETEYTGGSINSAYYIEDDGNYLVNATGTGGFSGGTVTCWVVVVMDEGSVKGVDRVVIDSNSGQSYINRVNNDDVLSQFEGDFAEGEEVSAWTGTGATMSLTAIAGAINTALTFVRNELSADSTPDPLAGYQYTDYINGYMTTFTADGNNVNYRIVTTAYAPAQAFTINITVSEGGVISAYEIEINGSTSDSYINQMPENIKDGSLFIGKDADEILALIPLNDDGTFGDVDDHLTTGATRSNSLCTYAALFAAANYELALENAEPGTPEEPEEPDEPEEPTKEYLYTQYIDMDGTSVTKSGNNVNYSVVTTSYGHAQAFTINITVGEGGVISDYEIATNGSTSDRFIDKMPEEVKNGSLYIGKNTDELLALLGGADSGFTTDDIDGTLATGATYSNFLCTYAALFASANYELALEIADEEQQAEYQYTQYVDIDNTSVTVEGNNVIYTIASNANGLIWGQFEISVTVGEGGIVTDFVIVANGSSVMPDQNYGDLMNKDVLDGSLFIGKDADGILAILSENGLSPDGTFDESADGALHTGATNSNFLCTYAALFAAANYQTVLDITGGAQ